MSSKEQIYFFVFFIIKYFSKNEIFHKLRFMCFSKLQPIQQRYGDKHFITCL